MAEDATVGSVCVRWLRVGCRRWRIGVRMVWNILRVCERKGRRGGRGVRYGAIRGGGGYRRGVHYAGAVGRDHRVVVRGRIWLNLVRDARGEAGVKSAKRVSELCVDFIDAYVEDGMESCEKSIGEVLDGGVERVG